MWQYYVYIHFKEGTDIPFYVGKGKLRKSMLTGDVPLYYERAYTRFDRNPIWKRTANKYGVRVEIYASCQTNKESQLLEIALIKKFGRKDIKTGILVNMTHGGDGGAMVITEERRKQASQYMKDNPVTPEWRVNMTAGRRKVVSGSQIKKGQKLSLEWRANLAKGKLGSKNPFFGKLTPISKKVKNTITGIVYPSITTAAKVENIPLTILYNCLEGQNKINKYPHIVRVENGL